MIRLLRGIRIGSFAFQMARSLAMIAWKPCPRAHPGPAKWRWPSIVRSFQMNVGENFRIAMRALSANKLRSGLTMLGIIIGVGAVVALMSIGNGATASITSQVQGIGSNLIVVFPGTQ